MNLNKTIARSTIYIYLGKITATLFSSFVFIIIAKRLTLAEYGLYSLFSSFLIFFSIFLPLGIPTAILRFVPELTEQGDFNSIAFILKKSFVFITVYGALFLFLSLVFGESIGRVLGNQELRLYLPIWALIGVIAAHIMLLECVTNALFLQHYNTIFESIVAAVQLSLILLFLKYGYSIYGIIMAIGIANILLFLFYLDRVYRIIFKKAKAVKKIGFDFSRFIKFSIKEYFLKITAFFWDVSIDIYLITYILGSASAGLYGFAAFISLFLINWMPGMALQNLIRPLLVKVYTLNKSSKQLDYYFKFYNKFKAFFIFPAVIGMGVLIDKIILFIFQEKFLPVVGTFRILLFALTVLSFLRPLNNIFVVLERNEIPLHINNVVIFYRVISSFLLIKYFGIQGAAWSLASSMTIIFLFQYIWIRKIIDINLPYQNLTKILFNSVVMGITILILRNRIISLSSLIVAIIIGIFIYIALSYLNKSFIDEERDIINNIIGVRIWRF